MPNHSKTKARHEKRISFQLPPIPTSQNIQESAVVCWAQLGHTKQSFHQLVSAGRVYFNGRKLNRRPLVAAKGGEHIDVYLIEQIDIQKKSTPTEELSILYEDEAIICFDKPAGLPTQPTVDPNRPNLYQMAVKKLSGHYLGLHHRLDRDTSGVILFTKDKLYNKYIADQFANHECQKTYLAIVHGRPKADQGRIESFLDMVGRVGPSKVQKFGSVRKGGKKAITMYNVIEAHSNYTLVQVGLLTGRTHQIRVHLSENHHPIVGDTLYGSDSKWYKKLGRFFLHAHSIEFTHPITQNSVRVESPLPVSFRNFLKENP